jgi:hypothetical protein
MSAPPGKGAALSGSGRGTQDWEAPDSPRYLGYSFSFSSPFSFVPLYVRSFFFLLFHLSIPLYVTDLYSVSYFTFPFLSLRFCPFYRKSPIPFLYFLLSHFTLTYTLMRHRTRLFTSMRIRIRRFTVRIRTDFSLLCGSGSAFLIRILVKVLRICNTGQQTSTAPFFELPRLQGEASWLQH